MLVRTSLDHFSTGTEAFSSNSAPGEAASTADVSEESVATDDHFVVVDTKPSPAPAPRRKRKITREDVIEEQYKTLIAKQANLALKKKRN